MRVIGQKLDASNGSSSSNNRGPCSCSSGEVKLVKVREKKAKKKDVVLICSFVIKNPQVSEDLLLRTVHPYFAVLSFPFTFA